MPSFNCLYIEYKKLKFMPGQTATEALEMVQEAILKGETHRANLGNTLLIGEQELHKLLLKRSPDPEQIRSLEIGIAATKERQKLTDRGLSELYAAQNKLHDHLISQMPMVGDDSLKQEPQSDTISMSSVSSNSIIGESLTGEALREEQITTEQPQGKENKAVNKNNNLKGISGKNIGDFDLDQEPKNKKEERQELKKSKEDLEKALSPVEEKIKAAITKGRSEGKKDTNILNELKESIGKASEIKDKIKVNNKALRKNKYQIKQEKAIQKGKKVGSGVKKGISESKRNIKDAGKVLKGSAAGGAKATKKGAKIAGKGISNFARAFAKPGVQLGKGVKKVAENTIATAKLNKLSKGQSRR